MAFKIKKGDNVMVISGNYKGQTGKVTAVDQRLNKVTIDGINIRTRHVKPTSTQSRGGLEREAKPIDASNVALLKPGKTPRPSRVGFNRKSDGSKVRVLKQANNKEIK